MIIGFATTTGDVPARVGIGDLVIESLVWTIDSGSSPSDSADELARDVAAWLEQQSHPISVEGANATVL